MPNEELQVRIAVENSPIAGYRIHEALIVAIAMVKKTTALANMEIKQLNPQLGNVIVQVAEEIIDEQWHDQFIVDPI